MFQTCLEGRRWDHIEADLFPLQQDKLWQQFGQVTRKIHSIPGESFGYPFPKSQFPLWSQVILDRLAKIQAEMQKGQLDTDDFSRIVAFANDQRAILDEIIQPRLLHGDLWCFNILVHADENEPQIIGILDFDRASWGDPAAEFTFFILQEMPAGTEKQRIHERFWAGYGVQPRVPHDEVRSQIYSSMHAGTALLWAYRHNDQHTIQLAQTKLKAVATTLS
jgi:aminoglycoside phosphotransferase (APT) family kinase protein